MSLLSVTLRAVESLPKSASQSLNAVAPDQWCGGNSSMNKGDIPAAAATHVAAPSIIDEFPPHHWSGATAFNDWLADFGKDSTARKVTDSKLIPHSARRLTVEGDHAYVVMPTDYTF